MINADALADRGFRELEPNLFVRLTANQSSFTGIAVWMTDAGSVFFTGCQLAKSRAKALAMRVLKALAGPEEERKLKARKVLATLFASDLGRADVTVSGVGLEDDLEDDIEYLVGSIREGIRRRSQRRQDRRGRRREARLEKRSPQAQARVAKRQGRRKRFKSKFNRFADRVAQNKVLQQLRNVVAKTVTGPIGKGISKTAGAALSIFGVPSVVTEAAVNTHFERQATRMRRGGYAGQAARATEPGKRPLRAFLTEEVKAYGTAIPKGIKATVSPVGAEHIDPAVAARIARARAARAAEPPDASPMIRARLDAAHGKVPDVPSADYLRAVAARREQLPGMGLGMRRVYEIGACF